MKKTLRFVAVALVTIIIFVGLLVACNKSRKETAQQLAYNAEYIIKTKEDPSSVMKEAYDNGAGPLKSFYLGYDFENPESYWAMPAYDFHSELRNAKGDILAEYEPFLLLKGETATGKGDYRIILFNDDYNIVSVDSSGEKEDFGKDSYPFENIEHCCSQALEAQGIDPNQGKPLEIYGTCDDTFIYVEKMVWYQVDFDTTYTYTTKNDASKKGDVPVEDWINTLKDKKFVIETQNLPYTYGEESEYPDEAKELCKKLSKAYLEADADSAKLVSPEKTLETYTIEKVEDLGDGYFVSSVFVFHPLKQTMHSSGFSVVICILIVAAMLGFALCVDKIQPKKQRSDDYEKEN